MEQYQQCIWPITAMLRIVETEVLVWLEMSGGTLRIAIIPSNYQLSLKYIEQKYFCTILST